MVINGLTPSNLKEWLWSAKVLTTLVWILFPLGYITTFTVPDYVYTVFYSLNLAWLPLVPFFYPHAIYDWSVISRFEGFEYSYEIDIPPIPLLTVMFVFAIVPAAYSSETFFRKRGEKNGVDEYLYIKKILYISLAVLIITTISLYYFYAYRENISPPLPNPLFLLNLVLYYIVFMLPAVPVSILLKLLLEHARKQFRFYYAKACFENINNTKSETGKAEYLSLGLDWYNKFVKRVTKSAIDVETIYSKMVSHSQLSNNILLDTIGDSFHNGDELKPMRQMLALLSCWKEGRATLVKESLRTKIKESSDLLIPLVTVIITIITTFFLRPPSQ